MTVMMASHLLLLVMVGVVTCQDMNFSSTRQTSSPPRLTLRCDVALPGLTDIALWHTPDTADPPGTAMAYVRPGVPATLAHYSQGGEVAVLGDKEQVQLAGRADDKGGYLQLGFREPQFERSGRYWCKASVGQATTLTREICVPTVKVKRSQWMPVVKLLDAFEKHGNSLRDYNKAELVLHAHSLDKHQTTLESMMDSIDNDRNEHHDFVEELAAAGSSDVNGAELLDLLETQIQEIESLQGRPTSGSFLKQISELAKQVKQMEQKNDELNLRQESLQHELETLGAESERLERRLAQLRHAETGAVELGYSVKWDTETTADGAHKVNTTRVTFHTPYIRAPLVTLGGVSPAKFSNNYNIRYQMEIVGVDKTGFSVKVRTWHSLYAIYQIGYHWLSVPL